MTHTDMRDMGWNIDCKRWLVLIVILGTSFSPHSILGDESWVESYDGLLKKYVTPEGVKYHEWKKNLSDLQQIRQVVLNIGRTKLEKYSKEEELAFYLNAYNAWILFHILQDYPTKGPGGGGFWGRNRFFKKKHILVAGKKMSFAHLENSIIRIQFKEPLIHFGLNCASRSCPPLHHKAFAGDSVMQTLDELARSFLNKNNYGVDVDHEKKVVHVSKIFDWFEKDFNESGGIRSFLGLYGNIPSHYKIKFQSYDWSLNRVK